jgi:cobalt/nickel transport protein
MTNQSQNPDPNKDSAPPVSKQSIAKQYNWLLTIAVVSLAAYPLFFVRGGAFEGADDRAETGIKEIDSSYKPWFQPVLKPASGEVETFLFAAQAALGAGTIGYVIGLYKGRTQERNAHSKKSCPPRI